MGRRGRRVCTTRGPALAGLVGVRTPALFLAGTADQLAPIPAVRKAFDAWGSDLPHASKRFVTVGRAHGHAQDYGHGDMAIGTSVAADLFAPIASFLEEDLAAIVAPVGAISG